MASTEMSAKWDTKLFGWKAVEALAAKFSQIVQNERHYHSITSEQGQNAYGAVQVIK